MRISWRFIKEFPFVLMAAVLLILFSLSFRETDGTCTNDQQQSCRKAAVDETLTTLAEGGHCMDKQYVQFTHVCTVDHYAPNIDYCCCVYNHVIALCCRYHHDWNYFRCAEADDTVVSLGGAVVMASGMVRSGVFLSVSLLVSLVTLCVCFYVICRCSSCIRQQLHRQRHQRYLGPGYCDYITEPSVDEGGSTDKRPVMVCLYYSDDIAQPLQPKSAPVTSI